MKLLNKSIYYVAIAFFFIIAIWSFIFYLNMKDEIRDSIDDGLENNKILILQQIYKDTALLHQDEFSGNNFRLKPISKPKALKVKDLYKDTLMYRLNEDDLEPVRILHSAFEFNKDYYKLEIISSLIEEDDLIEDAAWSIVWLFVILIISIIIINNLILKHVWSPFYTILNQIKGYKVDEDKSAIDVKTNTSEFIELQKASNTLIDRAKEVYFKQKSFNENASHELQTPLAVIGNKLEILLESNSLERKETETIASILHTMEGLKKLNKSLLLISKIENHQYIKTEGIKLNALIEENISNFSDYTSFKNINIQTIIQQELEVEMDEILANILITNLIKNAIFHNTQDGFVKIKLDDKMLTISNPAEEGPLDEAVIFERFGKASVHSKGNGIGLYVVTSICKYYNFNLQYHYIDSSHNFSIKFT